MKIETMSRDDLIEAIVDWQVRRFRQGLDQDELRHILLYGEGYKTLNDRDRRNRWETSTLLSLAKDLGMEA